MDVLTDVLNTVHPQSAVRFCSELTTPWGIRVPAQNDRAIFYVMTRGSCYLEVDGHKPPVSLAGGDLVMLSHGDAHRLCRQSFIYKENKDKWCRGWIRL